jgi:signal transduction histidine kinase
MQPTLATRPRRRPIRLDVTLLGTASLLLVTTLLPQVDPDLNIVLVDRTLDVALTSLTLVPTAGLTILVILRYRETGRLASFLQAAALGLWVAFLAVTLVLIVLRLDDDAGMSLGLPEQYPAWVSGAARLTVSGLFMASGIAAFMGIYGGPRRRIRELFLPVAILSLAALVVFPLRDLLPALIEPVGIEALVAAPGDLALLPGFTGMALATVVAAVTGLVAAVVLYRMTWARGGPSSDAFTALGLVILAVAEVQYALWPSIYSGLVTISDVMRLVAYSVLVGGTFADQRSDLRALRSAYSALDRLRVNDAERAALEERSRLAREIHDGLAQHLWFAKLKFERLTATLDESERPLADEVGQALDTAIVEAREALATMRASLDQDQPFTDMLARTVDDFEDRSGLRVDYAASSGLPSSLPPRTQVELLRIIQEALTNVRKHADATLVRVRAAREDGRIVITVTDNGRGFEQDDAFDRGLGLQGMRERARLIGGELLVVSELSGGTTVEVRAPLIATSLPHLDETEVVQGLVEPAPPPQVPTESAPPQRLHAPVLGEDVVRSEAAFTSMPPPAEASGLAPSVQTERR